MKSVIELREEQVRAMQALRAMSANGVETRKEEWEAGMADLNRIDDELARAIEAEKIEKRFLAAQAENEQPREQEGAQGSNRAAGKDMSYEGVYKRWLIRGKDAQLPPEEMRILETRGTNTNISSTNSLGGYLVPQSFSNELEMLGIWKGGMLEAARIYNDTLGGTLKWPTGDDTGTTGLITGQGVARTVQDLTFGNVLFSDYTIDSGIVKISRELMNDERVGLLQSVLAGQLAERINRKTNSVLTNGTGTNEPYGLTVAVTATGTTTAGATAITKAELVKHMYSVDKYYSAGANVGWMMHRNTLGYLRTLDFSTDTTHLFADLKIAGQPDMLLNYPVFINNDLPDLSGGLPIASTKHIYFGDFSKYVVRRIEGVSIERNDSLYWANLSAGFMGWTRLDGNLIIQGAIKPLLQHA
jgi:HK97 family phage major capsid protein